MLRELYRRLIDLHPRPFRQRFTEEMLGIFDQVSGPRARAALFADALVSLFRQWILRPEFRQPAIVAAAPSGVADIPIFRSLDDYKPSPTALLNGSLLSVALLCAVIVAIGHSGMGRRIFLIGTHRPSQNLFPVDRSSYSESALDTLVTFGPEPENPWHAIASVYFKIIRVLGALDADRDLVISTWETVTAPAALRKLDRDHDGRLSPEECGFSLGTGSETLDTDFVKRARLEFMRANPVLAALDADHDGEISAAEISNSSAALKTLDRNRDGSLTPDEVMPDKIANQAALIVSRLDTNGDGKISVAERTTEEDGQLRELLQRADHNHDGTTTAEELTEELRLREELRRQLEGATHAAGFHQPAKR